jgi:hypothetical protein
MYLSHDLHGEPWTEKNRDPKLAEIPLDDLMSAQGSCWFMTKDYYQYLELLDESKFGTFYNEFQEIGLKCWLSGGEVKVNKLTWYAHWHKPREVGRGYNLDRDQQEKALVYLHAWIELDRIGHGANYWPKQIHDMKWLVNKFSPVPTWEGLV